MPQFWGADSLAPLTQGLGGTNLANYIINVQYADAPRDQIVWWGRYFDHGTPSGNDHWQGSAEADSLSQAVASYDSPAGGKSWILPIASPYPEPGPSSTYATGVADGNYVAAVVRDSLSDRLGLPGCKILYIYLDVDTPYPDISIAYYEGWGAALRAFNVEGHFPLFPALYINTWDATDINHAYTSRHFIQSWSYEPQVVPASGYPCSDGGCDSPGPAWAPAAVAGTVTNVWQYSQNSSSDNCAACRGGQDIYVDLDLTNPSVVGPYGCGQCDYMLYIPPDRG